MGYRRRSPGRTLTLTYIRASVVESPAHFLLAFCYFSLQGVLLIAAIGYAVYRLTQRRFSQLDDIGDEIKWPELQQDFAATSTLNPSGTRRTGGAGIEMGEMDEAEQDVEAGDYGHGYEPVGYGGAQKGGYCAFYFVRFSFFYSADLIHVFD